MINDYRKRRFNAATEELENPAGTSLSLSQININNGNQQNWADIKPSQPYIDNTSVNNNNDPNFNNSNQEDWAKHNRADLQPKPYLSNVMSDEETDAGGTYNTLERIYSKESADQMSYEYSLEDGIMSKKSADTASSGHGSGSIKTDVPGGSVDFSLGTPGNSVYSGLTFDDESTRKRDEYGGILPHRASHNTRHDYQASPLVQNTYERVILAPKGKLGVVIDTTKHGPVVFQVKDGSPLQGAVFPGDRIIAIDDIDTTGMTANNITTIMSRKAELGRRITVVSKENVHGGKNA